MIEKTATTDIGAVKDIEVVYSEWDSLDEFTEHCESEGRSGETTLLERLNAVQRQNAFQTPKGTAREVLEASGPDSDEFSDALAVFKVKVANYRLSGARKVGDGIKQKESQQGLRKVRGETAHLEDEDTITMGELRAMLSEEGAPIS